MPRSYLDHASTSPLRPSAHRAMASWIEAQAAGAAGDPARIHHEGLTARNALEDARSRIASWLGVRPRQVVLTSGATESIAAACFGARARAEAAGTSTVLVDSPAEHSAVRAWTGRGPSRRVGLDGYGRVDPEELVAATEQGAAMVHLQWSNHEVSTRQDVEALVGLLSGRGVLVHVDAAQAGPDAPAAVASGADVVSLSGHKLGAPAGVGVMVVRRNLRLPPLLVGGDQERARRAGMENLAAVLGLAAVADDLAAGGAAERERCDALGHRLRAWGRATEGVHVLGHPEHHSPHITCLALEGLEPQPVLLGLDQRGVAVHSGSSCSSEAFEPSPVLEAMGVDAQRSLRLSVGWSTTDDDVDRALSALEEVLADLRRLSRP